MLPVPGCVQNYFKKHPIARGLLRPAKIAFLQSYFLGLQIEYTDAFGILMTRLYEILTKGSPNKQGSL